MAVNRLFTKKRSRRAASTAKCYQLDRGHEATEVSLCDQGMCFSSPVKHEIGAVLLVDFEVDATGGDSSLRSVAVVVDCCESSCGRTYEITVLFIGN